MTVRVIYRFRVHHADLEAFRLAYRQVVFAHGRAGHASLESTLLIDDEQVVEPLEVIAISRWESREAWLEQRNDEVDPEAYARFRELCEVEDKQVYEELELLQGGDPLDLLARTFDLTDDQTDRLFELVLWVEQELATERYGYARDNAIPPPIQERLRDPDFLRRLREAAADQEPDLLPLLSK